MHTASIVPKLSEIEPNFVILVQSGLEMALENFQKWDFCSMFGVGIQGDGHLLYLGSPLTSPTGVIGMRSWIEKEIRIHNQNCNSDTIQQYIIISQIQISGQNGLQIDLFQQMQPIGKVHYLIQKPHLSELIRF